MPFHPALERFGLEDRSRERGPKRRQKTFELCTAIYVDRGTVRRRRMFDPDEATDPLFFFLLFPFAFFLSVGAQGRTQTFNLWFVGPALRQLSYSGREIAADKRG
jgi:hypothetical protein